MMKMKKVIYLLFCLLPSICFGIDLNTKIAWEPWAINSAVMTFCMPELEDGKTVTEGGNASVLYSKKELGTVGEIPMLVTNWNRGGIIKEENVKLIPKCSAFIDAYIVQTQKNKKVSLNQIISICLDTIKEKLICENIVLSLVNITEDKKVLKKYDPKKMEQKIRDSVKADHTICSEDGKFCTTYGLFTERNFLYLMDENTQGDVIYKKDDNTIVGICAGVNYEDAKFLTFAHGNSRCMSTDSDYKLYEFDIQDFTNNKVMLTYDDYESKKNYLKNGLEIIGTWIQDLEKCISEKHGEPEMYRALNADYISLGLEVCEKDNSTQDAILLCKTQVLKENHKKITQQVKELTFEKSNSRLDLYKSLYQSYFLETKVLQHQTDLLLTDCEKDQ